MRVAFMGTPQFALQTLKVLVESQHEVIVVVTQPDKPNKRGNKVVFSPIKTYAQEQGIPFLQPDKIKNKAVIEKIKSYHPDVIVVVAYGQLLPKEILDFPRFGCINIHASLLPLYRGSAPIHWSIIQGESITGVSTMIMDAGMDTGDIIYKESVEIKEDTTVAMLHDILSRVGAKLLLRTLEDIEKGIAPRIPQDDTLSTYAPLLTKDTGKINWNKLTSKEIYNLVRGTYPWPAAYTTYQSSKIKICKTAIYSGAMLPDVSPGTIVAHHGKAGLLVKTLDGGIYIIKIHVPNKKEMHVDDYLKGNKMELGTILI
ncbi:MAG: methionyl-tRNA formyltransferase [Eubacteriales bacterium]